ncbi:MAG: hypothetical protein AAFN79_12290 [Pseudomonadota bacterium]
MTLEENIYQTLEAWRAVTRPIWDFLFGWIFDLVGLRLPWWVKDYLTMGLIAGFALFRVIDKPADEKRMSFLTTAAVILITLLTWPVSFLLQLIFSSYLVLPVRSDDETKRGVELGKESIIYFRAFVIAIVFIAINYVFVLSGMPDEAPIIEI